MGNRRLSKGPGQRRADVIRLDEARRSRARRPEKKAPLAGIILAGLLIGGLLGWYGLGWRGSLPGLGQREAALPLSSDPLSAQFGFCHTGGGVNCVVDGDTFWFHGEKVRVMDIDAPETHGPGCAGEAALGARATQRLQALMNAGPFSLESGDRDRDRYGRALRVVTRGGQSIGEMLVDEGLAREWDGARHPWC